MDTDTFYCSFVSSEYIICECGENFENEEALMVHLERNHKKKQAKVVVQKQQQLEDNVAANVLVYSETDQLKQRPIYFLNKPIKEEPLFVVETEEVLTTLESHLDEHHADEVDREIKQEVEVIYDLKGDYTIPAEENVEPDGDHRQYQTVVTLQNHLKREHNYDRDDREEEHFCQMCGKSFPSENSVKKHVTRMHTLHAHRVLNNNKKYRQLKRAICELCGKNYSSNAALQYHQRVHTGERPYDCVYCAKKFTMPLYLQIHLRTHTGERPYPCPICPKAFGNKAALLRHDRVHTGVKPYECPQCGKAFSQSNSMKLHVRTVHLRLPAPYKSKARKLKELQRAGIVHEEPVHKAEEATLRYDDDVSTEYDVNDDSTVVYQDVYSD